MLKFFISQEYITKKNYNNMKKQLEYTKQTQKKWELDREVA